jgi:hypothetical protein
MFCFKKIFLKKYFSLLTVVLLFSCNAASVSLYNFDYPLTNEIAKSKVSALKVKIPHGWFTADDNEFHRIDLWLVKDDYSENLQFTCLNLDSLANQEFQKTGLKKIAELSKDFKIARYGKNITFTNLESFDLGENHFEAYQYKDGEDRSIRVVVLKYGNKFYELTAIPVKSNNLSELYRIQNSVLSSLN